MMEINGYDHGTHAFTNINGASQIESQPAVGN
jgi:hypothetical protein